VPRRSIVQKGKLAPGLALATRHGIKVDLPRWAADDSGFEHWAQNLRGAPRRSLHPRLQATVSPPQGKDWNSDRRQPDSPAATRSPQPAGGSAPPPRLPACSPAQGPPKPGRRPPPPVLGSACRLLSWPAVWPLQRQRASSQRDLTPYTALPGERGTLRGGVTSTGELEAVRSVNVVPSCGVLKKLYVWKARRCASAAHCPDGQRRPFRDRGTSSRRQVRQAEAEYGPQPLEYETACAAF